MANQQLVDYIKGQVAAGVSRLDLEKAVAAAGWSPKDSADAFAVAEGRAPQTPAAPTAPVAPAAPVATPNTAPVVQPQPRPEPMRPATMAMNVSVGTSRSRTWLWVPLILALVAIGAAAAYYFVPQVQTVVGFYLGQAPASSPDDALPDPSDTTSKDSPYKDIVLLKQSSDGVVLSLDTTLLPAGQIIPLSGWKLVSASLGISYELPAGVYAVLTNKESAPVSTTTLQVVELTADATAVTIHAGGTPADNYVHTSEMTSYTLYMGSTTPAFAPQDTLRLLDQEGREVASLEY